MTRARHFPRGLVRWTSLGVCLTLLVGSLAISQPAGASVSFAQGRNQPRNDKARKVKAPEAETTLPFTNLPNLDAVKRQPRVDAETPAPIPSNIRSRRTPLKPWDGIRVGDPLPNRRASSQSNADRASTTLVKNRLEQPTENRSVRSATNKVRQKLHHTHARVRARSEAPPPLPDDQYLQNFFYWTLLRYPNAEEATYWNDILRAAYQRGPTSVVLSVRELGQTLFESAAYAGRGRSDRDYVYDLYKTYLYREPDQAGWDYWTSVVPTNGRANVRRAFDLCDELANLLATITPNGGITSAVSSLSTARVDPFNQSGNQLRARDAEWAVSLLNLPGRAGLDLGLTLSYSSLVWTRSGPHLYFDQDTGWPSPGFRLGFPTIQEKSFDAQAGQNVFVMIASSARVELRQVGTSNTYEAADSSYLQLIDNGGSLLVRSTDGTQFSYGHFNREWRCTQIKDRNGNYLSVNYDGWGHITTITDTLGRIIYFNYDGNANLISITQNWNGTWHTWATFGWSNLTMAQGFSGVSVTGTYNGEVIPLLTQVALDDGSRFNFEYSGAGQVIVIRSYRSDNVQRAYTIYDYTGSDDCPRLYQTRVWAENWTGLNGVPNEVTTQFNLPGDGSHQLVAPDGTVYKEYYGTGCQRGLVTQSETWSGGVRQKWTTTGWTQDNTSVNYQTNPRVTETNVYDSSGNRRRTTIDYSVAAYAQYGLPYFVREYAGDATTILRDTYTDYKLDQPYLDRRIIGLVAATHLVSNGYQAKVTYGYDDPARLTSEASNATLHDQNYHGSFTVRGNVTSVSRWDVTDINNPAKALSSYVNYNAAGSAVSATDPATHTNQVSYADSYSDGNNSRNTFAYPTSVTDADGFSSTAQYNFDFGAKTRVQGPPPAGQPQGVIQTMLYDSAARLLQVTTQSTAAYTRYVYGPNYVQSFSTVNSVTDDAYAIQVFDGAGRVIGAAKNHPGSLGSYALVNTIYDAMGRAIKRSNPGEINNSWVPVGDDSAGLVYTLQTYDWQGRPVTTTNQDGTQNYASYAGCGCAGGQVVTLTDEMGRQQKVYSDVLGRQWKSEILNWNATVYSATVNTFNSRDQVTLVRQWTGSENGGGAYQDTTMSYDGYGRLQTKHVPEQNAGTNTVYAYNNDNTIVSVTDARGASATYGYNNRHLVTGITYNAPAGSGISVPAAASFGYDAAGNRTSMSDGTGTQTYSYDQLSRLTSESRTFTGVTGSYALNYQYNVASQLTSLSLPFSSQSISYSYDSSGRLSSVGGSGFSATYNVWPNSYTQTVSNFLSNIAYRAWGAVKSMTYGNTVSESTSFNSRLQPTSYTLNNTNYTNYNVCCSYPTYSTMTWNFDYYNDGRLNHAWDATNDWFHRAHSYDHAGRVSEATTFRRAQGLSPYPAVPYPDPYQQTISYDGFGHMNRTGKLYIGDLSDVGTYVNNRRTDYGWSYDADGNNTDNWGYTNAFDAAGKSIHAVSHAQVGDGNQNPYQPRLDITQEYDGAGQPRKRVQVARQEYYFNEELTVGEDNQTSYYVRSSVLGGAAVAELIPNWPSGLMKKFINIYVGSQRIAKEENGSVNFEHHNPATGSWVTTHGHSSYRLTSREERDPMGAETPTTNPYPVFSYVDNKWGEPLFVEGGDPFDYVSGVTLDGMPATAAQVARLLGAGAISRGPSSNVTTMAFRNTATGEIRYALGIWSQTEFGDGFLPVGAEFARDLEGNQKSLFFVQLGNGIGYGEGPYNPFSGFSGLGFTGQRSRPQNSVEQRLTNDQRAIVDDLVKEALTLLDKNENCRNYLRGASPNSPYTELAQFWANDRITYFHGTQPSSDEPEAVAAISGGWTGRGGAMSPVRLVLFYHFFNDPEVGGVTTDYGISISTRTARMLTILHELKHQMTRRGHPRDDTGEKSDDPNSTYAYDANILKNCFGITVR